MICQRKEANTCFLNFFEQRGMSLVGLGEFSLSSSDDDEEEEPAGDEVGDEEGDDGSCGGSS